MKKNDVRDFTPNDRDFAPNDRDYAPNDRDSAYVFFDGFIAERKHVLVSLFLLKIGAHRS